MSGTFIQVIVTAIWQAAVLCSLIILLACRPSEAPDAGIVEAGIAAVKADCTLLTGVTDSGAVTTVCALADEVAQIVGFILGTRQTDSGRAALVTRDWTCFPAGDGAMFCATPREIGLGVKLIQGGREARDQ